MGPKHSQAGGRVVVKLVKSFCRQGFEIIVEILALQSLVL